jgi:rare lipoprotein A (peptidoglycan hydrolase)
VVEPGQDGLIVTRYAVTYVNGKVAARKLVERETRRAAKTRVVKYGTKDPRTQACKSTWYYRDGMVAAHRTLPKGTVVKVVNQANGKSVTVVIDDRGPYRQQDKFCLDLGDDAFAKLAHLGTGVIDVRLYW